MSRRRWPATLTTSSLCSALTGWSGPCSSRPQSRWTSTFLLFCNLLNWQEMSWGTRDTLNFKSNNCLIQKFNDFILGGLSPGLDGQVKIWTTPRSGINLIKLSWTLQVHVQYLGAFRGRVSRYLHRQSGRFHDSEKRIPWYQEQFWIFNKNNKSSD